MLNILNATVSHELRNPLSSIIGQNIKKAAVFKKIKMICHKNKYFDLIHGINELEECTFI